MTYHAVENYLRKFRKDAKEMRGSAKAAPSPARPTSKKARSGSPVKNGEFG
jgi:hypothetical protein